MPPRFTANSASTASNCSTAGRQRPQAQYRKRERQTDIRPPKAGSAGAARAPCTASPSPRCFIYADQADPAWRQRYDDEEKQRAFARMAAGAGASNGAGSAGAGTGSRNRQHRKLVKRSRYGRRHCIATAVADTRHALCVDRSSQHSPARLALRAASDPEVRNRNRCTRRPRQVVADHGGDAVTGLGQGPPRCYSKGATARLALEPGRPAGRNPAQNPGGGQALRAEAGRYREPAVCRQRARPAARHRDNEPEMVGP